MDIRQQLKFIFEGGQTKRFHASDTMLEQNVAAHSFGVAWLCYVLTAANPSPALLLAALSHDLAEHRIGDVSSPAKREFPELKKYMDKLEDRLLSEHELTYSLNLPAPEHRVLKMADYMEGMLHCIREMKFGNSGIIPIFRNFYDYTVGMKPQPGVEQAVLKTIVNMWNETTINGAKL